MSFRAFGIIVAGFLTVSIAYSVRYGYGMLLPEMLPAFDISKTQAGVVLTVYFVIYTICTPALGVLSDHYSYRLILTVFAAILGLGAMLMAYASTIIQASLYFSIAAFGHAACWAPVMVLVQKWVPDHRRGTALSVVSMGVGSGIFIWGLLLPIIVASFGWRSGWVALGLTGLVAALLNFVLVRNPPQSATEKKAERVSMNAFLASYQTIFRQSTFWLIGLAYLLVGFNVIILFAFLPVYARESLNVTYAISTRFISIIAFFGIIGQLVLGPLSDYVGRTKIMILCSLILGASCFGIVISETIGSLYLLVGLYGIGYGAIWPIYAAAAPDLYSRNRSGGVIGLWTVFLGIGSMTAPVFCGWIIDQTKSYNWVFLSAMIAGFLSVLLLLLMPKPAQRMEQSLQHIEKSSI